MKPRFKICKLQIATPTSIVVQYVQKLIDNIGIDILWFLARREGAIQFLIDFKVFSFRELSLWEMLRWVEYVRDAGCIAALELSTKVDKQPSDAPSCDKVMLCGNLRSGISTRTVPWCRSHCDAVTPVILSCSVNSPHWPGLAWWELPVYLHTQCPSCWPRLPIQHPSIGKKFQTR